MYRQPNANYGRHDVSVLGGIRGGLSLERMDVEVDLTAQERLSYLFQYGAANPGGYRTVNVANLTLGLRLSPR